MVFADLQCPPGSRPAPPGVNGPIRPMDVPSGVQSGTPPGGVDPATVLEVAQRYEGRQYGAGEGAFTDVSFVEQVLRDLGVEISDETHNRIFLAGVTAPTTTFDATSTPGLKGVQYALTEATKGDAVELSTVQPGDFLIYWWQDDTSWKRRSAVVKAVKGNDIFDLYGPFAPDNGVSTSGNINLGSEGKHVFGVRLKESAVDAEESGVSEADEGAETISSGEEDSSESPEETPTVTSELTMDISEEAAEDSSEDTTSVSPSVQGSGSCGQRLALVGDSLTACSINYVRFLRELCGEGTVIQNEDDESGTTCSNRGGDKFAYVGKRTNSMKSDFSAVLAWNPDTIVLIGGGNDLSASSRGVDSTTANLRDMFNMANERGIRTVSATMTPMFDEPTRISRTGADGADIFLGNLKSLNEWILSESNPADVKVNLYPHFIAAGTADDIDPGLFGGDKLHPNAAGKRLLAQKIYEGLMGAAPASSTQTPSTPGAPASTAGLSCIPDAILPSTLYDFILNSSSGITTIIGIARQNIAVGINKSRALVPGDRCMQVSADRDYDIDQLKETYGQDRLSVEAQLQDVEFMDHDIRVHRLISPALACVQGEIRNCPEGRSYDYRIIDSYIWQSVNDNPNLLATSSFGISLNINMDTNPNDQSGELTTDIPECVVNAFKNQGFKWGGDFEEAKAPAHFEFMTDPDRITALSGGIIQAVGTEPTIKCSTGECIAQMTMYYADRFSLLPYIWGGVSPYDPEWTHEHKDDPDSFFQGAYVHYPVQPGGNELRSGKPMEPGFDCSGFAWWIFRHAGVPGFETRRGATGQRNHGLQNGELIACRPTGAEIAAQAQPGDLIFWSGRGSVSQAGCNMAEVATHVAIYVGNGQYVESGGTRVTLPEGVDWDAWTQNYGTNRNKYGGVQPRNLNPTKRYDSVVRYHLAQDADAAAFNGAEFDDAYGSQEGQTAVV